MCYSAVLIAGVAMRWARAMVTGLALIAAAGAAVLIGLPRYFPACTAKLVDQSHRLFQSDGELAAVQTGSRQDQCRVYRRRLSLMSEALATSRLCGPPHYTDYPAWPVDDRQLTALKGMIGRQCGEM